MNGFPLFRTRLCTLLSVEDSFVVLDVVNMMKTERKTTPGQRSNTSVYISSLLLITSGSSECVCICVCVCGPIRCNPCSARPKAVGGDECLMDR